MKLFLCLLFALSCSNFLGQTYFYTQPARIPANYSFNPDSAYRRLLDEPTDLKDKDKKDYAEALVYYHHRKLSSGNIYFNWPEIEDYLNKLVLRITKGNNINKQLKVFLVREEDVNASAMDNGIIYINIGLLADIEDEATLSGILCHEISHAVNADMKKSYSFSLNNKLTVTELLSQSHGSRLFEARADSAGFLAVTNLDYNISGAYHSFIKFETEYRWHKSQYSYEDPKWHIALDNINKDKNISPDSLEKFLFDHPDNYRRIAALNKFLKVRNGSKTFIEDEKVFNSIKAKARIEQLFIDFTGANYKDCLRNAFYYHLSDQSSPDYLYYITECLRRMILNDPSIKRKGFLTEDSKEIVFEKNKGILNDVSFITLDTIIQKRITNDSIYGKTKKPFETYSQAYSYYIKKTLELKVPGSGLTAGLFELTRNKTDNAAAYLKSHIAENNASCKEFVLSLISGSCLNDLKTNTNDFVYLKSPEYYIKENDKLNYSFVESEKISGKINPFFRKEYKTGKDFNPVFFAADSLNISEHTNLENLAANLRYFKNEKETETGNIQDKVHDSDFWKSKETTDPLDPEVLIKKKNFFHFDPASWAWFKNSKARSLTCITPYFYKHPARGTFFYFRMCYFNPVNRQYCYFEQEYLERYTDSNMRKVFKAFEKKLSELKSTDQ